MKIEFKTLDLAVKRLSVILVRTDSLEGRWWWVKKRARRENIELVGVQAKVQFSGIET